MNGMTFTEATTDFADLIAKYASINPDDAKRVADFYESDYASAVDGDVTVWGRFTSSPTKGDVVADYRCYIRRQLGII